LALICGRASFIHSFPFCDIFNKEEQQGARIILVVLSQPAFHRDVNCETMFDLEEAVSGSDDERDGATQVRLVTDPESFTYREARDIVGKRAFLPAHTHLTDAESDEAPFDVIGRCLPEVTSEKNKNRMDPRVLRTVHETLRGIKNGALLKTLRELELPTSSAKATTADPAPKSALSVALSKQSPSKKKKKAAPVASRKRPQPTPSPAKANPTVTSPAPRMSTRRRRTSPAKKYIGSKT
jgi:hypothetical protein